ncbi:nucleoporin Pom152 [Lineolata rhizophorae]|uniref:Nucleoporin Pom152 n=1 Tax=Lineolata rhizophorae TaxID=578093 RepID=A0A6A6P886_9PEZI|nr:nucleoporin Pom152 [Lineolata rhizophorae]
MYGTPRLRSAFPATPPTARGRQYDYGAPNGDDGWGGGQRNVPPLHEMPAPAPAGAPDTLGPVIPFNIADAPTQRFWVCSIWVAFFAWRLFDMYHLVVDETESLWLFMKWVAIDGIFLYGVPAFRIPWLEWSPGLTTILFLLHAGLDAVLMFRIQIPVYTLLVSLTKILYDSELTISEHWVNPKSIMHNESLILGKQIVHILPEGSAHLNTDGLSFCLGGSKTSVQLPIQINQTTPALIELHREDLDTSANETISIGSSAAKKMKREAERKKKTNNPNSPLVLEYTIKKTGIYRLDRVVDASQLEVQTRSSKVEVVSCPKAWIMPLSPNKCKGELSEAQLVVEGTPPLKIKYRKMVNDVEREVTSQSIQPPGDFMGSIEQQADALVPSTHGSASRARSHTIEVPLTESLTSSGTWVYSVEQVQDALGNVVNYTARNEDGERIKQKNAGLEQSFVVHDRPTVTLDRTGTQNPLRIAKGSSTSLPIILGSTGQSNVKGTYRIEYFFTPEDELLPNGDRSNNSTVKSFSSKNPKEKPTIHESGLYSLKSVSTDHCSGDVLEPASCLLQIPPRPSLSISTEAIEDKCAGNPIGLRVSLDLTGTPPFVVYYSQSREGEKLVKTFPERINGMRHQIELQPPEAGRYTYTFLEMTDDVYKTRQPLSGSDKVLKQTVKPAASAHFTNAASPRRACIDESVEFDVRLQGEGPWALDYELVHGGKRQKRSIDKIETETYKIHTDELSDGGNYTLALVSITDKANCREFLNDEATIMVRHQRPKGSFGHIGGKRTVRTLEGKPVDLPLRLTGEGPWSITYQKQNASARAIQRTVKEANGVISVDDQGSYELVDVKDNVCPGVVDGSGKQFEVLWVPRPRIVVPDSARTELRNGIHIKPDVCEGDDDNLELLLQGSQPFEVKYEERVKLDKGSRAPKVKDFNAGLGVASVRMETAQPGEYDYKFLELSDSNYDTNYKKQPLLNVKQRVNPLPTAQFEHPGKTYSYCAKEGEGKKVIPVTFTGQPPFELEVEIRHHSAFKPEVVTRNSTTLKYDLTIPHHYLHKGNSQVWIRKVRDARGCQRTVDPTTSPRVQVAVHEAPTIIPVENRQDYCVGDRLSFVLSGMAPFNVYYTFQGQERRAHEAGTSFRRIAEKPGEFVITGVTDAMSECRSTAPIERHIHELPSVRVGRGRESRVDIHEGGQATITFQFWGAPPFEFVLTRSTTPRRKGDRAQVLETEALRSEGHELSITRSEEGTYEVVAIRDKYCSFAKQGYAIPGKSKLLQQ